MLNDLVNLTEYTRKSRLAGTDEVGLADEVNSEVDFPPGKILVGGFSLPFARVSQLEMIDTVQAYLNNPNCNSFYAKCVYLNDFKLF
jgi:hypothetical protein